MGKREWFRGEKNWNFLRIMHKKAEASYYGASASLTRFVYLLFLHNLMRFAVGCSEKVNTGGIA